MTESPTISLRIDEGVMLLMASAYRLGKGDPKAPIPLNLAVQAIRLIQSDAKADTATIMAELEIPND